VAIQSTPRERRILLAPISPPAGRPVTSPSATTLIAKSAIGPRIAIPEPARAVPEKEDTPSERSEAALAVDSARHRERGEQRTDAAEEVQVCVGS
jgi:hypothetical protein